MRSCEEQSLPWSYPHRRLSVCSKLSRRYAGIRVCKSRGPPRQWHLEAANLCLLGGLKRWTPVSVQLDTASSKAVQSLVQLQEEANHPKELAASPSLWHSRASHTLARALEHPWSTCLLAFIQGNCFDTQFKRSGRFALHVHLWTIIPGNKSRPGLTELHGAMPV